jgi:DNA-binding response OmpR family regulator
MSKVKILLVDDDEDDHFLVAEIISDIKHGEYELDWARTFEEGKEKLLQADHDIYLVDYRLGAKTGLDLLRFYKETTIIQPFIILTGKGEYQIDIDAMSLGASDYLIKGTLSPDMLERAIRYSLEKTRATRLLFEQEAKYKTLFQKSLDAIFITNRDQYFEDINDSFIDLFGAHHNIKEYHV